LIVEKAESAILIFTEYIAIELAKHRESLKKDRK